MPTLYVTEYALLGYVGNSQTQLIQAPAGPPIAEQHVQVGGASVTSAPFNAKTKFIRIVSDTACNLAYGPASPAPVAVPVSHLLPANSVQFEAVSAGYVVAVIANS